MGKGREKMRWEGIERREREGKGSSVPHLFNPISTTDPHFQKPVLSDADRLALKGKLYRIFSSTGV